MKRLVVVAFLVSFAAFALTGCGAPKKAFVDVKAHTEKLSKDDAYNAVTTVLVDKGFDVKMGNKDIGLVTTEFKKFGSTGSDPAFDLYLQIKAMVKERPDGKISIVLTPLGKDVNRLNSAAFTEHELFFYEEKSPWAGNYDQAWLQGQTLFLNVAQGIAEVCGLSMGELEQNVHLVGK